MGSQQEVDTKAFSTRLDQLLAENLQEGLRVEDICKLDTAWELVITSDRVLAHQHLARALDDEELRRFLLSWSEGDLIVSVRGPDSSESSPAVLVRDGTLGFVSGGRRVRPVEGSFSDWFQKLVGAPLPIDLNLRRLQENVWGSSEVRRGEVEGLPHTLRLEGLQSYSLMGYAGYGMNSYALYLTRVSGDTQMFLRLPWGGAYMNADEGRPLLLSVLAEANAVFEEASRKGLPMCLKSNMGSWSFTAAPQPDRESSLCFDGLERARKYVDSGSEGQWQ